MQAFIRLPMVFRQSTSIRRAGHQRHVSGVVAGDEQRQALHGGAQQRQHGQTVRRGAPGQAQQAGNHGAPAKAAGCQQQHQHHRRIDQRIGQGAGQRRQRRRHQTQHQQHRCDGGGGEAGRGIVEHLLAQFPAYHRGVLGALVFMVMKGRDLRRLKGLGSGVRLFIPGFAAQSHPGLGQAAAAALPAGALLLAVLQRFGQPDCRTVKAGRAAFRHRTRIDGLGNVMHKGSGARFRRFAAVQILGEPGGSLSAAEILGKAGVGLPAAQVLGEAGMGRGLGGQTNLAGQCIDQLVHRIRFPPPQQTALRGQSHHLGVGIGIPAVRGCRGRLLCRLYCGFGRFNALCRLRRGFGRFGRLRGGRRGGGRARTNRIVGVHEVLGAVHRGCIQCSQLHGKARAGRLMSRQVDGLPHRLSGRRVRHCLGRRCRADLLAGGKFHRVALFAINGAGGACGTGRGARLHAPLNVTQHLHGIPFPFGRRGRCRTGIFAVPDVFHRIAPGFFPGFRL